MGRWGRVPGCSCRPGGREWGDRNTTELPRSPSGPRMATSGGGETPARSGSTKTEDSSCRRGPRPGSLAHIVRGTIPGVRPPGFRAPGLPCVSLGRPRRRRPAWAARPVETKRPWRRPRPRPPLAAPPPSFLQPLWGAIQGRGSARGRQGEGPACPVELLFCMTQWFLEKALLGFLSEACAWRGMRVGLGDQWDPNLI